MQQIVTVDEAARYLRQSAHTIRNWIKSGKLAARKVGRSYLITREAVIELVAPSPRETPKIPLEESRRLMAELIALTRNSGVTPKTLETVRREAERREDEMIREVMEKAGL